MILEKFRKKNHQIWSSYEEEILITKFNCGSKKMNRTSVLRCRATSQQQYIKDLLSNHVQILGALVGQPCFSAKPPVRIPASLCASFFSKLLKYEILVYKQGNTTHQHNRQCRPVGGACARCRFKSPYRFCFWVRIKTQETI